MNYNNTSYPPPLSTQAQHYNVDYKPMPQESEIPNKPKGNTKISGKWLEIAICFVVMTVPMLIFSALLLGLIYKYRVKDNDFVSSNLRFTTRQSNSDAVYVDLNATLLTTVASWSSTVAPILVGFAITLLTFPVAKGMMNAANLNQPDRLPTPYQLALMIRMNTASAANSIYHWLRYILFFRKGRANQPSGLTWMTIVIVIIWLLRYVT
jgi:ABC-type transport system involved in multi-copper enzyme maturation permease subunit